MRLREEGTRGRRLLKPPAIRRRLLRAELLRISGDRMPHDVEPQRRVDEEEQCYQHDDAIDVRRFVAVVVINEEPDEEEELAHVGGHHHTKPGAAKDIRTLIKARTNDNNSTSASNLYKFIRLKMNATLGA